MEQRTSDNLLLIAARAPIPGFTKTRLGESIGHHRASALYLAFLTDLAARFASEPGCPYQLGWSYTPAGFDIQGLVQRLNPRAASDGVRFVAQNGETWGDRQTNLLRWGHNQGYVRTVLMASDSPQLPREIVERAFAVLHTNEVTFGRVHDGGYYLIGVRGFHDVLSGVPMSTSSAAEALAARAVELNLRAAELPSTFDIDVIDDLDLLVAALAPNGAAAPHSWQALCELGLVSVSRPARIAAAPS